jgi:hypothetical protein
MAFRAGRRKLAIAGAVGAALVAALVTLQLVDDGDSTARSSDAKVHVKGITASRPALLIGRVDGADGLSVEVVVISPDGETHSVADPDGRYRVTGLAPGPVVVSWVGSSTADAGGGISLGTQRTGRTEVTLDAGRNRLDLDL